MDGFLDGIWRPQRGGRYLNRYNAGRALAAALKDKVSTWKGKGVVVGLPRGGVLVARAVANDLKLPLDFRAVRKVGHPSHEEFAIGAVDISGISIKNPYVADYEMPPEADFQKMVAKALERAKFIDHELRQDRPSYIPDADWCLIVDDGAATGLTILVAVKGLKAEGKVVHVAVPASSESAQHIIEQETDSFTSLQTPDWFMSVSQFYEDFGEVSTEQARNAL